MGVQTEMFESNRTEQLSHIHKCTCILNMQCNCTNRYKHALPYQINGSLNACYVQLPRSLIEF